MKIPRGLQRNGKSFNILIFLYQNLQVTANTSLQQFRRLSSTMRKQRWSSTTRKQRWSSTTRKQRWRLPGSKSWQQQGGQWVVYLPGDGWCTVVYSPQKQAGYMSSYCIKYLPCIWSFSLKTLTLVLSQSPLFSRLQNPNSQPGGERFCSSDHLHDPPLNMIQQVHVIPVLIKVLWGAATG